jgi:hypothetical protein
MRATGQSRVAAIDAAVQWPPSAERSCQADAEDVRRFKASKSYSLMLIYSPVFSELQWERLGVDDSLNC